MVGCAFRVTLRDGQSRDERRLFLVGFAQAVKNHPFDDAVRHAACSFDVSCRLIERPQRAVRMPRWWHWPLAEARAGRCDGEYRLDGSASAHSYDVRVHMTSSVILASG